MNKKQRMKTERRRKQKQRKQKQRKHKQRKRQNHGTARAPSMSGEYIMLSNDGPLLTESNYWDSKCAAKGTIYFSVNAGAIRILLPDGVSPELLLAASTAQYAIVSLNRKRTAYEVLFEDGTQNPYAVMSDISAWDRLLPQNESGREGIRLLIYTRGCSLSVELEAKFRVVPSLPYLKPWPDSTAKQGGFDFDMFCEAVFKRGDVASLLVDAIATIKERQLHDCGILLLVDDSAVAVNLAPAFNMVFQNHVAICLTRNSELHQIMCVLCSAMGNEDVWSDVPKDFVHCLYIRSDGGNERIELTAVPLT